MKLIHDRDLEQRDLPAIESPFFAICKVRDGFGDPQHPLYRYIENWLTRRSYGPQTRDERYSSLHLDGLLRQVERGELLLVHTLSNTPFCPVIEWQPDDEDPEHGRWALTQHGQHSSAHWRLEGLIERHSRASTVARRDDDRSWWGGFVGGATRPIHATPTATTGRTI